MGGLLVKIGVRGRGSNLEAEAAALKSRSSTIVRSAFHTLGRRIEKLVRTNWDGTAFTTVSFDRRYAYDGWNLVAEYSVDSSGALALVRTYTWGLDIAGSLAKAGGVGALLEIVDHATGKTYFPTYDGNGNVTSLVNADSGSLAATYEYSPFGEMLRAQANDASIADQPFRFSTKFWDGETGLYAYIRRYYDPRTGRWLSRDPKEELGGLNLYAYLTNEPVDRWDYLGMGDGFFSCGQVGGDVLGGFDWSGVYVNGASEGGSYDGSSVDAVVTAGPMTDVSTGQTYGTGTMWIEGTAPNDGSDGTSLLNENDSLSLEQSASGGATATPTVDPSGCSALAANYHFALASLDAYPDYADQTPPGMTRPTLDRLSPSLSSMLNGTAKSQISISVFQDNKTGAYVVSFRGTWNPGDWETDFRNALGGVDPKYIDAEKFAQGFTDAYGTNVTFTGHSLGGGLAAAAALTVHLPAVTFNAAGVGSGLGLNMTDSQSLITNYHTVLDPVTFAQRGAIPIATVLYGPFVGPVVGSRVDTAAGTQVTVHAAEALSERHSMANMVNNYRAMYTQRGCGEL